jgi:ankyrin repeat protein
MWAAAENHADVVKLLLERGADVNATSAVFDFTTLRPKAGSIPMNFPRGGFSALLFAARQGAFDAAKTLVERGADVNIADPDNTSPLLIAVINFHYDLAAYLIEKGADVNKADKMGRAPLYAAIDMRNLDVSTRPSPRTDDKRTALDIIRLLLDKGADTNAKLAKVIPARGVLDGADGTLGIGATPFLRAARSQDLQVMKMLLDKGADWKLATADNATAMHLCAGLAWRDGKTRGSETGSIECLQMLLDKGADIQAQTVRTGEMPLHGAAARGADKIVQFLVDKGANPTAKDKTGRTPLDVAMGVGANVAGVRAPQESTVALLKQLIAKASPQASSEQPKP